MAEMGIRNGPKPKTESKNGSPALLAAIHDPNAIFLVPAELQPQVSASSTQQAALSQTGRMMSAECQVLLYVVGLGRLELPTSPLSVLRSSVS
jgi:hypothetical protein